MSEEYYTMTRDEVMNSLHSIVNYFGTQSAAAYSLGVSPAYLCDILAGRREPGGKLLSALKLRRVVLYEDVRPEA